MVKKHKNVRQTVRNKVAPPRVVSAAPLRRNVDVSSVDHLPTCVASTMSECAL